MLVMKFGGTSMGNAARMSSSVDIICNRSKIDRLGVIVSAVGGVSNRLQDSVIFALTGTEPTKTTVTSIKKTHSDIISDLSAMIPKYRANEVENTLNVLYTEFERLLDAIAAFGECPETIECRIMGLGEQFCVPIVAELLHARGEQLEVLDSRKFIITEGRLSEGDPVYEHICENFTPYRDKGARILLAPGFISTDVTGKASLLGRNGSDFSAALMAMGLNAKKLEIWSDVDGIFTADPRVVSDAILVDDLSYEEAMELSFFGSKVLHPKTIHPIMARGIETWSLNSFNPSARGTRITSGASIRSGETKHPVCGISCLKDTAMVNVAGAGLKGKRGTAARVFASVSRTGVSVLLITQSSSEYTISFCVKGSEAKTVKKSLEEEFSLEIREGLIDEISIIEHMAIVSIVGDGMKHRKGVAGTLFSSLAFGGINIHAIAQGSSERSISTVVADTDGDKAVRIAHRFFFETRQTIELFLFGIGVIGGKLLEQIRLQKEELKKTQVDLQVWAIANSRKMLINSKGIDLDEWKNALGTSNENSSVEKIISYVLAEKPLNPVFVDCTTSDALPEKYPSIFGAGMHIVTPNKRGNSVSLEFYRELRNSALANKKRFLYETNVGAGLPIIDTFRSMLKSGDSLIRFSGIMSGSLSYIFGLLEDGVPFSKAVREAREKGFTESDPRDDLSFADMARKALIIAREAGIQIELSDVVTDSLFPVDFDQTGTIESFLTRLESLDSYFASWVNELAKNKKVLRSVAEIDGITGSSRVGALVVSTTDPLASIRGGENVFAFTTKYYSPVPLVIHGYGAGADVTASGIFADILRTTTW